MIQSAIQDDRVCADGLPWRRIFRPSNQPVRWLRISRPRNRTGTATEPLRNLSGTFIEPSQNVTKRCGNVPDTLHQGALMCLQCAVNVENLIPSTRKHLSSTFCDSDSAKNTSRCVKIAFHRVRYSTYVMR